MSSFHFASRFFYVPEELLRVSIVCTQHRLYPKSIHLHIHDPKTLCIHKRTQNSGVDDNNDMRNKNKFENIGNFCMRLQLQRLFVQKAYHIPAYWTSILPSSGVSPPIILTSDGDEKSRLM